MNIPEDRLKKLESLYHALNVVSEGNYVYITDMDYNYSRWSKRAVNYFGLPSEYMYNPGDIWLENVHPNDRAKYIANISAIFEGREDGHEMQYRAKNAAGEYVFCSCLGTVIKDENDKPLYFCGTIKNHSSYSYIDNATGLRSLYGFFDDLKSLFMRKKQEVVMLLGMNGFSNTNDMLGYSEGNHVLLEVGKLLQECFGKSCSLYRMDGTKFAVIAHGLGLEELKDFCKDAQKKLTHDFVFDGKRLNLSMSASAFCIDNFDINEEIVYSCLKYAYYESKNKHFGALTVFENSLTEDSKNSLERLTFIRNSITDNCKGFFLCYQPIVSASTEDLKGAEALIRWKNDTYGMVPPIFFIPMLEQDVLFPELGLWILRTAMGDAKRMLKKYPGFVLNVNVSYVQLEKRSFVADVFDIINKIGFPPQNLCLEITERCRLLDKELLKNSINAFKAKGIKIAMDDFGTGYSSIGILRDIPVDTVKIDREFVKDVEVSDIDRNTVKSIACMARSFGAKVCAEGVETAGMQQILNDVDVNTLQGYYYSKPVVAEEFYAKYNMD